MEESQDSLSSECENLNPYRRITKRIDSTKIRSNQKRDIEVNTSYTQELNVTKDVGFRAGAIIYTKINGQCYFCLGIDTQSGNLTDFGGGVKKGETIIEGGLRELEEESQGVFGKIDPVDIVDTLTFNTYNMSITFIPLNVKPDEITTIFNEKISSQEKTEVCNIIWLTKDELLECIHGRGKKKLYVRVRKLLAKVTSIISDL